MRTYTIYLTLSLFSIMIFSTSCSSEGDLKKDCIDVPVVRNGKLINIDSCFTAPTSDSLDRMIAAIRRKQFEPRDAMEAKLYFIIVDTLQKKPDEYEYAIVVSDAGIINPDVILTNDAELVKAKISTYIKENIIFKKVKSGESIPRLVETIFQTNVRINWRREGNRKVKL